MAKILVIDDDVAITELMSVLLKTFGFETLTTNSGVEGVRLAVEAAPNVVLLDLMMPDLDGWQVCKEIRKANTVPILVLSAINDPRMVASVLDAGADDFLVKPVPSGVLVANINKLVRRTTGSLNMAVTNAKKKTAPLSQSSRTS
ncbi:MAG: response regulator transcription factor [Anaerolineales bacterium]|nr:response regulator transcription factor [Anaerolineales bacterium]